MTEARTKTVRRPKATPFEAAAPEAAPEPPVVQEPTHYAKVSYNHKPSTGDLQTIVPRLLEALAPQLKDKTLADVPLVISTTKEEDGNWTILLTA